MIHSPTDLAPGLAGSWAGEVVRVDLGQDGAGAPETEPSASTLEEIWRVCGGAISGVQDSPRGDTAEAAAGIACMQPLSLRRASDALVCLADGSWSDGPLQLDSAGQLSLATQLVVPACDAHGRLRIKTQLVLENNKPLEACVLVEATHGGVDLRSLGETVAVLDKEAAGEAGRFAHYADDMTKITQQTV